MKRRVLALTLAALLITQNAAVIPASDDILFDDEQILVEEEEQLPDEEEQQLPDDEEELLSDDEEDIVILEEEPDAAEEADSDDSFTDSENNELFLSANADQLLLLDDGEDDENVDSGLTVNTEGQMITVGAGESVTLAVDAYVNIGGIHYQWYRRDDQEVAVKIEGAADSSYKIEAVNSNHEYYCEIRDDYNSSWGVWFEVRVDSGLSAFGGGDIYAANGESVELKVEANVKKGSIHYQWKRSTESDTTPIPGATEPTYVTEPLDGRQSYVCSVSDDYGNSIDLSFDVSELRVSPVGDGEIRVGTGKRATLEVEASAGEGDHIYYEWAKWDYESSTYYPIADANENQYVTEPIYEPQRYRCRVRNDLGSYRDCWFDVRCENGFVINTPSYSKFEVKYNGTKKLTVDVEAKEGVTVNYRWYTRNETDEDVYIEGASGASYTTPPVTRLQTYYCEVSDNYGNTETCEFEVTLKNSIRCDYDEDVVIEPGDTRTLSVNATTSAGELHYQWYTCRYTEDRIYEETIINGAAGASYSIGPASLAQQYICRVSDDFGHSVNCEFYVRIDNIISRPYVSEVYVGYGETAVLEINADVLGGGARYSWYERMADLTSVPIAGAEGASYETEPITESRNYIGKMTDDYGNIVYRTYNVRVDNAIATPFTTVYYEGIQVKKGERAALSVEAYAKEGELYYQWSTYEGGPIAGATSAEYETDPLNRTTEFTCTITDDYGNKRQCDIVVRVGLSVQGEERVYAAPGKTATLSVTASGKTGDVSYQWYKYNANGERKKISGATNRKYTTAAVNENQTYYCKVTDEAGSSAGWTTRVYVDNLTASCDEQTVYVAKGKKATLSVKASVRTGKIHYQWYEFDANNKKVKISGATGASYVTGAVNTRKSYYCKVTDDYGSCQEFYFGVRVDNLHVEQKEVICYAENPGDDITLTVDASVKKGNIYYQWYQADEKILKGTGKSLLYRNAYRGAELECEVKDDYGNVETVVVYIRVNNDFSVEGGGDMFVAEGETTTLSVDVTTRDGNVGTYIWEEYIDNERIYENWEIVRGKANYFETDAIDQCRVYRCKVSDTYFNREECLFYVHKKAATGSDTKTTVTKATTAKAGKIVTTCASCQKELSKQTIPKAYITLSSESYTYNGKVRKPEVYVRTSSGKDISSDYYTVTYENDSSKNAGTYGVTVKLKGNYSGTTSLTYKIKKASNTITDVTTEKTLKYSTLKSKNQTFTIAATVKGNAAKTFALTSVPSEAKPYITVSGAGKVTVKKGLKKGTYKIKVKITAASTKNYNSVSATKTITITVK